MITRRTALSIAPLPKGKFTTLTGDLKAELDRLRVAKKTTMSDVELFANLAKGYALTENPESFWGKNPVSAKLKALLEGFREYIQFLISSVSMYSELNEKGLISDRLKSILHESVKADFSKADNLLKSVDSVRTQVKSTPEAVKADETISKIEAEKTAVPDVVTEKKETAVKGKRKDGFSKFREKVFSLSPVLSSIKSYGGISHQTKGFKGGEYDGLNEGNFSKLDRSFFMTKKSKNKEQRKNTPDIIADMLYREGLISEPDVDMLWSLIRSELDNVKTNKELEAEQLKYWKMESEKGEILSLLGVAENKTENVNTDKTPSTEVNTVVNDSAQESEIEQDEFDTSNDWLFNESLAEEEDVDNTPDLVETLPDEISEPIENTIKEKIETTKIIDNEINNEVLETAEALNSLIDDTLGDNQIEADYLQEVEQNADNNVIIVDKEVPQKQGNSEVENETGNNDRNDRQGITNDIAIEQENELNGENATDRSTAKDFNSIHGDIQTTEQPIGSDMLIDRLSNNTAGVEAEQAVRVNGEAVPVPKFDGLLSETPNGADNATLEQLNANTDLRQTGNIRLTVSQRKKINERVTNILERGEPYTSEEIDLIRQYTGQGGLKTGNAEALTQHYTSYSTIKAIFTALQSAGLQINTNTRILEPSAGSGNFLGQMPEAN